MADSQIHRVRRTLDVINWILLIRYYIWDCLVSVKVTIAPDAFTADASWQATSTLHMFLLMLMNYSVSCKCYSLKVSDT